MKIYFVHGLGKSRRKLMAEKAFNVLMSYYSISTPNHGFDAKDCFDDIIKEVKKNEDLLNIQKH